MLVAVIVSAYIVAGSVILQHIDEELRELPFYEVLLFSYTTLTTIGTFMLHIALSLSELLRQ